MLSPDAQRVAQVLGSMLVDLTTEGRKGSKDLAWLRDTLPQRVAAIDARGRELAAGHAGTDAELQVWYNTGHAYFTAWNYVRWARAPLDADEAEQARWAEAIAGPLAEAAAHDHDEAERRFGQLADPGHPAAADSVLPAIGRQMLDALAP
ncbi:MAG: hypothetical protein R3F59_06710 [Myxococcota bacterium]